MSFRVAGIGELLWDRFPDGDRLGGAPANFAFHAGQLGATARIVSRVGRDADGDRLVDSLAQRNLVTEFIQRDGSYPTGTVRVALNRGQPSYGIESPVAWDFIELTGGLKNLATCLDAVCFGTLAQRNPASRRSIQEFIRLCPKETLRLFDINLRQDFYIRETIEFGLSHASALKLNGDELREIALFFGWQTESDETPARLFKLFPLDWIAVTHGADGCEIRSRDEFARSKAPEVTCVDAVGAGRCLFRGVSDRPSQKETASTNCGPRQSNRGLRGQPGRGNARASRRAYHAMTPLPFGISQYTTWPQTFAQDLELFREAGIDTIEVCEGKMDVANSDPQLRQIKEMGLHVSSVQPRLHSLFPDAPRPEPKSPRERMACLRKTIELFGRYFPGTTIVSISGAAPDGDYDLAFRTATLEYREIARVAADNGVRIALEPLNPILMNVDTFICSIAQAGRVIEAVEHPQFGLFLDVWHFFEEADAAASIQKYGGKIFGVHVNDWRTPRAFGDRYLPGDGIIPLVPLLKAIRNAGYNGTYTLEIFSETRLSGSLWADPRHTVIEGKKSFAKIWEQVCA